MKNVLLIVLLSFTLSYAQTHPAGGGTSANPYIISTLDELKWVQANTDEWDKYYEQTANIDISSITSWGRIGHQVISFTGTYDGKNHVVSGMTINVGNYAYYGFFGVVENGTIKNLGVTGVSVTTGNNVVGGLIGECRDATVTNCYSTGSITSNSFVGGLIGRTLLNHPCTISECYSECNVTSTSSSTVQVGGFVGYLYKNDQIEKSYATGNVSASSATNTSSVGGFAGYNKGVVSECYSKGNVEGNGRNGGFVGTTYYGDAHISNCYSLGNVTLLSGTLNRTGGFVGFYGGGQKMENCYSVGHVTSSARTNEGFAGSGSGSNANATNCFFDTETSGQLTDDPATGKTTAEMKTAATFTGAGWDFTLVWQIIGTNYPDLINNTNGALPVELTSFTATAVSEGVLLNWETATEVNNYGFEVEASNDGETFNKVGFVAGHGNSNSPKSYSYLASVAVSYRLKQIDTDGSFEYSAVVSVSGTLSKTELSQNYPNPFNPTTEISFSIAKAGNTELSIYNILGQKVTTLVSKELNAGSHKYQFDASNLTSGIYFYKLQSGDFTSIKKMMLLK